MYDPIAKDDDDTICALLSYYRKIYKVVGSIILVGGVAILPFLTKLVKGDCPTELNIYILFIMYLLNTALTYLLLHIKIHFRSYSKK